jgi:ADP-ribose pyrophosphatase YjhB (NUDIX family)
MNFCSNCGSSQIGFEIPDGDTKPRYICGACGTIHYQNPKVVVGTLPIFENKILLCKRGIEPRLGMWNLPAGFMENGETMPEGARRETWEEAGIEVEIDRVHTIYHVVHINQVLVFFLAKLPHLDFEAGIESIEVKLFESHQIPWNELAFPVNRFILEKYLENPHFEGVHMSTFSAPPPNKP